MSALLSTRCMSLANFLPWKSSTCPKTAGKIKWEKKKTAKSTGNIAQEANTEGYKSPHYKENLYGLNLESPAQYPTLKAQCLVHPWRCLKAMKCRRQGLAKGGGSLGTSQCCLPWLQPALSLLPAWAVWTRSYRQGLDSSAMSPTVRECSLLKPENRYSVPLLSPSDIWFTAMKKLWVQYLRTLTFRNQKVFCTVKNIKVQGRS